ncbi:MAG: hypothetical protein LRS48_00560 [Desulfurococcales archaeon]|nr:hypothetical protein [Desulfurococcales archaeon]
MRRLYRLLPVNNGVGGAQLLLVLPCNSCVRMGDYSLCDNWRIIIGDLYWHVAGGLVDLAAVDSCKPGIVVWGGESRLRWCDIHPSYTLYYHRERWRLPLLKDMVRRDVRELLSRYKYIVYYVNVKAYREAMDSARSICPERVVPAGPERLSPLSYRSRRSRAGLKRIVESLLSNI